MKKYISEYNRQVKAEVIPKVGKLKSAEVKAIFDKHFDLMDGNWYRPKKDLTDLVEGKTWVFNNFKSLGGKKPKKEKVVKPKKEKVVKAPKVVKPKKEKVVKAPKVVKPKTEKVVKPKTEKVVKPKKEKVVKPPKTPKAPKATKVVKEKKPRTAKQIQATANLVALNKAKKANKNN